MLLLDLRLRYVLLLRLLPLVRYLQLLLSDLRLLFRRLLLWLPLLLSDLRLLFSLLLPWILLVQSYQMHLLGRKYQSLQLYQ